MRKHSAIFVAVLVAAGAVLESQQPPATATQASAAGARVAADHELADERRRPVQSPVFASPQITRDNVATSRPRGACAGAPGRAEVLRRSAADRSRRRHLRRDRRRRCVRDQRGRGADAVVVSANLDPESMSSAADGRAVVSPSATARSTSASWMGSSWRSTSRPVRSRGRRRRSAGRTASRSRARPVYDGLVITGFAGAENGVRGRVKAFDARDGRASWTFYTVPGPRRDGTRDVAAAERRVASAAEPPSGRRRPSIRISVFCIFQPATPVRTSAA